MLTLCYTCRSDNNTYAILQIRWWCWQCVADKVTILLFYFRSGNFVTDQLIKIAETFVTDQYVIVGAHIDSWTTGAIDAGTGYAVLMDLVRTFSQQRRCTGASGLCQSIDHLCKVHLAFVSWSFKQSFDKPSNQAVCQFVRSHAFT